VERVVRGAGLLQPSPEIAIVVGLSTINSDEMKVRFSQIAAPIALAVAVGSMMVAGCGSSQQLSVHVTESSAGSSDVRSLQVMSSNGSDTLDLGGGKVREWNVEFQTPLNESIVARVWYPVGHSVDTSKLVVMIPGYGEDPQQLWPLALRTTELGYVTAIISPRGSELNKKVPPGYGIMEMQDAGNLIRAYILRHQLLDIKVAAFGASLGSSSALNLAAQYPAVKGVVVEGLSPDLDKALRMSMSEKDRAEAEAMLRQGGTSTEQISPTKTLARLKDMPIYMIWGSNDQQVPAADREQLKDAVNQGGGKGHFEEVPGAGHNLRYGFPLSQAQANELNDRIAGYLAAILR